MLLTLLLVAFLGYQSLAASELLENHSGKSATGIRVTFSERVRITGFDASVFASQEPMGRAQEFTFVGGFLPVNGGFSISWTPGSVALKSREWLTEDEVPGFLEPAGTDPRVARINRVVTELLRIPFGDARSYYYVDTPDEYRLTFYRSDPLTAPDILDALTDLAALMLGIGDAEMAGESPPLRTQESGPGQSFRASVSQYLFSYPPSGISLLVFHTGTYVPDDASAGAVGHVWDMYPPYDDSGPRAHFYLYLTTALGRDLGLRLGMSYVKRQFYYNHDVSPKQIAVQELQVFFPDQTYFDSFPTLLRGQLAAHYKESIVSDEPGEPVVSWQAWLFEHGNPTAIGYRPLAPP